MKNKVPRFRIVSEGYCIFRDYEDYIKIFGQGRQLKKTLCGKIYTKKDRKVYEDEKLQDREREEV